MQVTSCPVRLLGFMSIVSPNLYTAPCLAFSQISNFSASDFVPAPPQLLNKSEAEKHHKTNDCSFLSSFIAILTMSPHSHSPARQMPALPTDHLPLAAL